jgi:hypothetical protein
VSCAASGEVWRDESFCFFFQKEALVFFVCARPPRQPRALVFFVCARPPRQPRALVFLKKRTKKPP